MLLLRDARNKFHLLSGEDAAPMARSAGDPTDIASHLLPVVLTEITLGTNTKTSMWSASLRLSQGPDHGFSLFQSQAQDVPGTALRWFRED